MIEVLAPLLEPIERNHDAIGPGWRRARWRRRTGSTGTCSRPAGGCAVEGGSGVATPHRGGDLRPRSAESFEDVCEWRFRVRDAATAGMQRLLRHVDVALGNKMGVEVARAHCVHQRRSRSGLVPGRGHGVDGDGRRDALTSGPGTNRTANHAPSAPPVDDSSRHRAHDPRPTGRGRDPSPVAHRRRDASKTDSRRPPRSSPSPKPTSPPTPRPESTLEAVART